MIEISRITEVNQYITGLKAIVFDLDDTLFGEKEYVRSGYRAVAGILPQVKDCEEKLWRSFEGGKSVFDEVLQNEGIYTDELKQKCLSTYRFQQPDIHLYDGVAEMFVQLGTVGYKLGIITDGRPESQRAKIEALRLRKYVDHIIITDELGGIEYRKPNDTAFRMMRERLGAEYFEMCYVGDNIKKDFMAPKKLGMKCICFRNNEGLYYNV